MAEGYALTDAHFIQIRTATSAANDHSVSIGPVPPGKVWTVLSGIGHPSVNETQDYWFAVSRGGVSHMPVTFPTEIVFLIAELNGCPIVREGMELKLFPDDYIWFHRDAHTVGSTITIQIRYIETDLPLYEYLEPQLVKKMSKFRAEVIQRAAAAGGIGTGGGGGRPAGFRGGSPRPK